MANTVDKVIQIAKNEVGYLEKASNKNLDDKTKNVGSANYTKYGRDMHNIYPAVMDFPAPWCDAFVDWCFYKAYGVATAKSLLDGNFDDYTVASAQMYKNKGAYFKSNPQVGDQIFFKNSNGICHTGLVYKIDDKNVYTIEGNTSGNSGVVSNGGGVWYKQYSLTYNRIDGYGRPKYYVIKEKVKKTTSTKKTNNSKVNSPSKINSVKTVQQYLVSLGYSVGKSGIDGVYGKDTRSALIKYLNNNGGISLIKKGNKGGRVKAAQMLLICKGYSVGSDGADGDFGTNTYNAVKKYQKAKKLLQDGVVGDNTFNSLLS